jgi:tetratricopeptide (TPR) repeat protein
MKQMLKFIAVLAAMFTCFSCNSGCIFFFGASGLGKEAKTYVDEVIPKIVDRWDVRELVRDSSSGFLKEVPVQKLEEQFFFFMKLGTMKKYEGSNGQVFISKSSIDGRKFISGEYVAQVAFEDGHAVVTARVIREGHQWKIYGFFVNSNVLTNVSSTITEIDENKKSFSRSELEETVNKLLEGDIVVLRRSVDKVFSLAETYENEGGDEKAISLYEKALQADPADLLHQLNLAKMLIKNNRGKDGISRLRYIYEYAEDDQLLNTVEDMLKSMNVEPPQPTARAAVAKNLEILLISVGKPSSRIVSELKVALQDKMGMQVTISDQTLEIGDTDRTNRYLYVSNLFSKVKEGLNTLQCDALMEKLGINADTLSSPAHQSRFINAFFEWSGEQGQIARRGFESEIERLGQSGQYDMTRLNKELCSLFPVDKSNAIKSYLGVTSADVYTGDCSNCYGSTLGSYGIVSTYQFSAAHNGEQQCRPRLLARTLKQALSSIYLTLGIPRCNNPYCARSFPYTLSVHDAKSDELCQKCKARLQDYIANPHSTIMATEYLKLNEAGNARGQWDEALKLARKALENSPESGVAYERIGYAYAGKGLKDLALANYRKSLELHSESIVAHAYLGDYHRERHELKDAVEHYSKALERAPEEVGIHERLGTAYLDNKEWANAIEHFEIVARKYPDNAINQSRLGHCYYNLDKTTAAKDAFDKAIAIDPNLPGTHYMLGWLLSKAGERDKAIEQFKKEIEINPSHFDTRVQLARQLAMKGFLDEAISIQKAAVVLQPDNVAGWNDLGYSYFLIKDYAAAIVQYEKAISVSPDYALVHYNKAVAHYAMHQFQEAIVSYDKAAALGYPGSPKFRDSLEYYRK